MTEPTTKHKKTHWPLGLMARSQMILWLPLMLLVVLLLWAFFDRLWDSHSRRLAKNVVADIALATHVLSASEARRQEFFALLRAESGMELSFSADGTADAAQLTGHADDRFYFDYRRFLQEALRARFPQHAFQLTFDDERRSVRVAIDGVFEGVSGVLLAYVPRGRLFISTTFVFLAFMLAGALVFFGAATLFLRNQVRPIRQLATAMRRFDSSHQRDDSPLAIEGAAEVRAAIQGFRSMRSRLRQQWQQRNALIMALSHDLNTVVTRMKLQLELMAEKDDSKALLGDVKHLQMIIDEYLDFLRDHEEEALQPLKPKELIAQFKQDYAQQAVIIKTDGYDNSHARTFWGRPRALRRCFANLVMNGLRFGSRVDIALHVDKNALIVTIDDDGEGIPPDERKRVLEPFYRLDAGRNLDSGGVGLGLTIAQDVVSSHNGSLILEESPLGGLRVRVMLPRDVT